MPAPIMVYKYHDNKSEIDLVIQIRYSNVLPGSKVKSEIARDE